MALGRDTSAPRRFAGRLARRLPPRARHAIRGVLRSVVPRQPPPNRVLEFPGDVSDSPALQRLLADTDIFGDSPAEGVAYLADALERFRITMALLPPMTPGARILELGANPYFLTRLLRRRGLDVTCANYFGGEGQARRVQTVTSPTAGIVEDFEFDHFNVEREPFPYDDGVFDLVLCCEILEHLPTDATHLLAECHRVLRTGSGRLLLTTPNAVRLENALAMSRGQNVYEGLSGYGAYGRHNRVYTLGEVRALLEACGYEVEDAFDMDIHDHSALWAQIPPTTTVAERGCNLFAVARKVDDVTRWRYPAWLYQSVHGYRRIVRDDLVVGVNDDLQSAGLHTLERVAGRDVRWTGAEPVVVDLVAPDGDGVLLEVEGLSAPRALGRPLALDVTAGGRSSRVEVPSTGGPFSVAVPVAVAAGPQRITLAVETWTPARAGLGEDTRSLGVCLTSMRLSRTAGR